MDKIEMKYAEKWNDMERYEWYKERRVSNNEVIMCYLYTKSDKVLEELYCRSIVNWSNTEEEWLDKIKPEQCKNCCSNCSDCGLKDMFVINPKKNLLINKSLFLKNK